jgi:hypothetical protein
MKKRFITEQPKKWSENHLKSNGGFVCILMKQAFSPGWLSFRIKNM